MAYRHSHTTGTKRERPRTNWSEQLWEQRIQEVEAAEAAQQQIQQREEEESRWHCLMSR